MQKKKNLPINAKADFLSLSGGEEVVEDEVSLDCFLFERIGEESRSSIKEKKLEMGFDVLDGNFCECGDDVLDWFTNVFNCCESYKSSIKEGDNMGDLLFVLLIKPNADILIIMNEM
jgi:hypothetical protein